jgi:TraY domain-containing protein
MSRQPRRTGRPTKPRTPGARVSLGLKVTDEIKHRLDTAAQSSGRTQSQEAEARLERSFRDDKLLPQLLEIAYGQRLAGLLMALGRAMRDAGGHASIKTMNAFTGAEGWFDDNPVAYEEARRAAEHILDALRPTIDPAAAGVVNPTAAEGLGVLFAKGVLRALSNPEVGGEIGDWATSPRSLLGPSVARIGDDFDAVAVNMVSPNATMPAAFALLKKSGKRKGSDK